MKPSIDSWTFETGSDVSGYVQLYSYFIEENWGTEGLNYLLDHNRLI